MCDNIAYKFHVTASSSSFKGQGVDIWAAGITLFCFVFGKVSLMCLEIYCACGKTSQNTTFSQGKALSMRYIHGIDLYRGDRYGTNFPYYILLIHYM